MFELEPWKAITANYSWSIKNKKDSDPLILKYCFNYNENKENLSKAISPNFKRYSISKESIQEWENRISHETNGVNNLTNDEQNIIKKALQKWQDVANIKFEEVKDESADIIIKKAPLKKINGTTSIKRDSDEYISKAYIVYDDAIFKNVKEGEEGFKTILHEIGHALGLKHPSKNTEHDHPPFLDICKDNQIYTIMSYNNITKLPKHFYKNIPEKYSKKYEPHGDKFFPSTPAIYDVKAVQILYGKNSKINAGNNGYNFQDSEKSSQKKFYTIWDPAGRDTIDASKTTTDNLIDLRYGSNYFSNIGNNYFSLCYETEIENVKAGSGNDIIHGSKKNVIYTGDGEDIVFLGYDKNLVHANNGKKLYILDKYNIGDKDSITHINNFKKGDKISFNGYREKSEKLITDITKLEKFDIRRENISLIKNPEYIFSKDYKISAIEIENVKVILYGETQISKDDFNFIDN